MQIDCVLTKLRIQQWNNSRQDKGVTEDVRVLKNLSGKAGRWVKYKLPEAAFGPVREIAGEARRFYYDKTLPWDEGLGLLPTSWIGEFESGMSEIRSRFIRAVDAIQLDYDKWIDQARVMLGKTYNDDDYPSVNEFVREFAVTWSILPLPSSNQFDASLRQLYGSALERDVSQRIQAAESALMTRILEPLSLMATKLADPKGIFRDTLIENIKDVMKAAPGLNVTQDARVSESIATIENMLANVDADMLRTNKIVRKEVAEKAAKIVSSFGALGARKFAA